MAMSDADKLTFTCSLAGIAAGEDDAALISTVYLPLAKSRILEIRYPYSADPESEKYDARYDKLQCEIAAYLWGKRGAEGEVSHKENGVDRSWGEDADLPKALVQRIIPKGKVVG